MLGRFFGGVFASGPLAIVAGALSDFWTVRIPKKSQGSNIELNETPPFFCSPNKEVVLMPSLPLPLSVDLLCNFFFASIPLRLVVVLIEVFL
jgi:hypothetical protein